MKVPQSKCWCPGCALAAEKFWRRHWLQLELLMAFMWRGAKKNVKKVLVLVLPILFSSSIGIGIGDTFYQG